MHPDFEPVIGLEVHAQLSTKSKAFCGCATEYGAPPNTNVCPVCLGHPGALPVFNEKSAAYAIRMGLATHSKIRPESTFARKNYFYPDLPKGYQITQYDDPICYDGFIEIETGENETKKIGITRIHLEEDTGKSIHDLDIDTLMDLNRCGSPLIEIVSEPDMRSPKEAYLYMRQIRQTLVYLGICDGNLEEGSLRCDANVSVRRKGAEKFGTRTEVKNINSFRNVERAIEYEINRQIEEILAGGAIIQETRMWDAGAQKTRPMRSKEESNDYRYFPEPDLLKLIVSDEWIESERAEMPELPLERKRRLIKDYSIPAYDAGVLAEERTNADYYEQVCAELDEKTANKFKLASNWIMTEVMRELSERNIPINELDLSPKHLAELIDLFGSEKISSKIAKEIFPEMLEKKSSPKDIVKERGLEQVSDIGWIEGLVKETIDANPDNVEKYKSGKTNLLGFLVGQVLKQTKGKANPKIVNEIMIKFLEA